MYAPQLGRFISRDPVDYSSGVNLYEFAGSNSIARLDPFGLTFMDIVKAIGEGVGAVLGGVGGCTGPPPPRHCGTFTFWSVNVPISDPQQMAVAGGSSALGYMVSYDPKGCCPGGTIEVYQAIQSPKVNGLQLDVRFDENGIAGQNGTPTPKARPQTYVGGGGLGPTAPPGGKAVPKYGFRDAPMVDMTGYTYYIEICANCRVGGTSTLLGCVKFQWNDKTRMVDGLDVSAGLAEPNGVYQQNADGSTTISAVGPRDIWGGAVKKWTANDGAAP